MSLIHDLTEFCDQEYKPHCQNDPCLDCTHPSGKCSGSCLECSKQINYHTEGGRSLYNCQNYIYYYTVKYSWKYVSEIMYGEYQKARRDMQEIVTIKANIDTLMGYTEPGRKQEKAR